jgi:hypothetical protein
MLAGYSDLFISNIQSVICKVFLFDLRLVAVRNNLNKFIKILIREEINFITGDKRA